MTLSTLSTILGVVAIFLAIAIISGFIISAGSSQ